jgi:hypothetical protein
LFSANANVVDPVSVGELVAPAGPLFDRLTEMLHASAACVVPVAAHRIVVASASRGFRRAVAVALVERGTSPVSVSAPDVPVAEPYEPDRTRPNRRGFRASARASSLDRAVGISPCRSTAEPNGLERCHRV